MAGSDALQKVFKTLSDPTRVRILQLLESEELAVQELMQVLGMAQSRVSRHLAILREAGLLRDRRDGTYVIYRFALPEEGPWRDAWALISRHRAGDATAERDAAALRRVIEARSERSQSFFDAVGPEWDALRKVFDDDLLRARAVCRLAEPGRRVVDVGTGTGVLAVELARLGLRVVAIDSSARMLDAARAKLDAAGLSVELRQGDAHDLPLADDEVDAAFAHMVLHSLHAPAEAVREMARVVRPGGVVVVADFVSHQQEWMRQELGVVWLGFPIEQVEAWLAEAGLTGSRVEVHELDRRELPASFVASARVPERS
jgi:ubiquinone/menaquinone biosynthesis C-methylase UbiE